MASLLDSLRGAGAHEQAAALAAWLPTVGRFQLFLFLEQQGHADQFRFGREADGTPAAPWGWENLDLWLIPRLQGQAAPIERTSPALRVLHTPVTSAPSAAAIWTAYVPTPPAAPLTSTRCPARTAPASRIPRRAVAPAGDRRRLLEGQAHRLGYHLVCLRARVLGERAPAEAEHLVAVPQSAHVRAGPLHPSGRVDPGHPGLRLVSPTSPMSRAKPLSIDLRSTPRASFAQRG